MINLTFCNEGIRLPRINAYIEIDNLLHNSYYGMLDCTFSVPVYTSQNLSWPHELTHTNWHVNLNAYVSNAKEAGSKMIPGQTKIINSGHRTYRMTPQRTFLFSLPK